MRDPLSWSIPLFRAFGIQVRLHILYIVVVLSFIFMAMQKSPDFWKEYWKEYLLIWVVMLFVIILLHEFGHCFAARREGGDASEILMGPLGGLASCEVPHTARAHFVTAAGGPLVNVVICTVCTLALFPFQYLPPLNPLNVSQLYWPQLYNWSDGATHYKEKYPIFVKDEGAREIVENRNIDSYFEHDGKVFVKMEGSERAFPVSVAHNVKHYNTFVLWTARLFWLSWMLLLFNLIPAFPLDGGRLLQSSIWGRTGDYRRATMVAIYAGFAFAFVFAFISFGRASPCCSASPSSSGFTAASNTWRWKWRTPNRYSATISRKDTRRWKKTSRSGPSRRNKARSNAGCKRGASARPFSKRNSKPPTKRAWTTCSTRSIARARNR